MKTTTRTICTILCGALLAVSLSGCGQEDASVPVTTAKVKATDTLSASEYSATVRDTLTRAVIPNISGKVVQVHAELGQQVKAGDVLMELDTADALLSLKQARAGLVSAQANYNKISSSGVKQSESQARQALESAQSEVRDATDNYNTVKDQFDRGVATAPAQAAYDAAKSEYDRIAFMVSIGEESEYSLTTAQGNLNTAAAQLDTAKTSAQNSLTNAETRLRNAQSAQRTAQENYTLTVNALNPENVKAAKASIESSQVAVEIAQKRIDDSVIRAPIDGVIAAVNVKPGDMAAQQAAAFEIYGNQTMEVEVSVTESAAAKLAAGSAAQITITASGEVREGSVATLSPSADPATGTFTVKVAFADSTGLRDGMNATVRFSAPPSDQVFVPLKSLIDEGGAQVVYAVRGGSAARVEVTPGDTRGAYIAVSGLAPEDEVIVQGADRVGDGAAVHIVSNVNG